MNCTTYVFGRFSGAYTQYPLDSTKEYHELLLKKSDQDKQMFVHRKERQMLYTFVRKIDGNQNCIGISLVISSMMVNDLCAMYSMFEDGIRSLAIEGEILDYNGENLVIIADSLESCSPEVKTLTKFLSNRFSSFESSVAPLPPRNFSVSTDTLKKCKMSDRQEKILSFIQNYGITQIYDDNIELEGTELTDAMGKCPSHGNKTTLVSRIKNFFRH